MVHVHLIKYRRFNQTLHSVLLSSDWCLECLVLMPQAWHTFEDLLLFLFGEPLKISQVGQGALLYHVFRSLQNVWSGLWLSFSWIVSRHSYNHIKSTPALFWLFLLGHCHARRWTFTTVRVPELYWAGWAVWSCPLDPDKPPSSCRSKTTSKHDAATTEP